MATPARAAALVAALALAACSGTPAPAPAAVSQPSFATLAVTAEAIPDERVWDGVVSAVDKATVSAQTGGRVVELPFDVNDYVAAGAVIVRFTDVEQQSARRQAEAALHAAEATDHEAQLAFERAQGMIDRKLIARSAYDEAAARRESAKAALEAARAALRGAGEQVDYTVVRAPYSGILTERHVRVGETVRAGQPLLTGLSLTRLRIEAQVPQGDVGAIRDRREAAILLGDGRRLPARAVIVFPEGDPATHSFRVRVELPEAETGLMPGMTAKVAFATGSASRLLAPASALVHRGEVTAAYVVDAGGRVALRQVRTGERFGDRVEILAGLAAGERIAADPLAALAWIDGGGAGAK